MTAEGFFEGRRLQMARGVLLQCIMGGYPPARFYGSDDGDLALVAEPSQIHRLPWSEEGLALAICDANELDGRPSALSTRGQLKAVIARYAALGLAPVVATELEFFVFAPNTDPQQPFLPPVGKDGRRELGHSAFSVSSNNGLRPFFQEVYQSMAALGLPRDTFMHEMGVSQFEINLLHGDPLLLADQTFLFKHLLKEVALKHGLNVVCMAKPLAHTLAVPCIFTKAWWTWPRGVTYSATSKASRPRLSTTSLVGSRRAWPTSPRCSRPTSTPTSGCATLRFAEQCLLVRGQPRGRPAHSGQCSGGAAGREPPAGCRRQPLPGHCGQPGRRPARYRAAPAACPGDPGRVRGAGASEPAVHPACGARTSQAQRSGAELFGSEFIEGYIASKTLELTDFFNEITPGSGACSQHRPDRDTIGTGRAPVRLFGGQGTAPWPFAFMLASKPTPPDLGVRRDVCETSGSPFSRCISPP